MAMAATMKLVAIIMEIMAAMVAAVLITFTIAIVVTLVILDASNILDSMATLSAPKAPALINKMIIQNAPAEL